MKTSSPSILIVFCEAIDVREMIRPRHELKQPGSSVTSSGHSGVAAEDRAIPRPIRRESNGYGTAGMPNVASMRPLQARRRTLRALVVAR